MTNEAKHIPSDRARAIYGSATKDTMPFVHFKANVASVAGMSMADADRYAKRVSVAYFMGESVQMVADELSLRHQFSSARKTKSPRELAQRIVRVVNGVIVG